MSWHECQLVPIVRAGLPLAFWPGLAMAWAAAAAGGKQALG
jgi:hypothetical protein